MELLDEVEPSDLCWGAVKLGFAGDLLEGLRMAIARL